MTIIASCDTFPNLSWWAQAIKADTLLIDTGENFQKMSFRNRYRISGANNSILLSIPLTGGRDQHRPVKEIRIFNEERWQVQHWRTLVSVYRRSPYFEYYETSLQRLFETSFTYLKDFNMASIHWAKNNLRLKFELQELPVYAKDYAPEITDVRNPNNCPRINSKYQQIFEDRLGFLPNLSILDLLFSEGPASLSFLHC